MAWYTSLKVMGVATSKSLTDDGTVVISTVFRRRRHHKQYIAVLLIVLAMLAIGSLQYYKSSRAVHPIQDKQTITKDEQEYETAQQQSRELDGKLKYDDAIAVLNSYAGKALDNQRKIYTLTSIANIYETQKKNDKALAEYRQAEKIPGNDQYVVDIGIARTSFALGDKATALTYYKLCIPLLQAQNKDHFRDDDIRMIQSIITQIEALQ